MKDFETQLEEITKDFNKEVFEILDKAAEETAKEIKENLRSAGGFKDISGKYRKSWTFTKEKTSLGLTKYVVHVKKPHFRLTHLLEFGHATRDGGRTRAFPHIETAEKNAQKLFEEKVIDKLDK